MTDYAEAQRLVAAVTEFYRCENDRDWAGVATHVTDDITSHTFPGGHAVVGKDAYLAAMIEMYRGRDEYFEVLSICGDARTSTVHAELVIAGKWSVNVFELRGERIARVREYLGAGYGAT